MKLNIRREVKGKALNCSNYSEGIPVFNSLILASKKKMVDPKYRGILKEKIPMFQKDGIKIKVIAGKMDKTHGPVLDLTIDIEYFDVELAPGKTFEHGIYRCGLH